MTTNRDWLFGLPLEEQYAWMNAEHVESPTSRDTAQDGQVHQESGERALESVTAALERKSDSREKIEAEALKLFLNYPRIDEKSAYFLTGCVAGFLDRQAAITERKLDAEFEAACNSCATKIDLREEVDKLTAERDTLQGALDIAVQNESKLEAKCEKLYDELDAAYAKNRSLRQHISQMQNGRNEWHVKAVRLEKQLEATNKRCERYRSKFGKCLDYADAIHALADEIDEGMA